MTKLPLDYCRCRGLNCPVRDNCLRYTDWPKDAVLSFMSAGEWQDGVCLHLIPDQPNVTAQTPTTGASADTHINHQTT